MKKNCAQSWKYTYPALKIDQKIGQPDKAGQKLRQTIYDLLTTITEGAESFDVVGIDDGEDFTFVDTIKGAMELIFNLDECLIIVKSKKSKSSRHYIALVLCNDEPADVISDWSYHTNDHDGFNALMDKFLEGIES